MERKKVKYSFGFLTESEESKLHSFLKKNKVNYDHGINFKENKYNFIFEEALKKDVRFWLEAQGGICVKEEEEPETPITEDVEEVTRVEDLELDSLISQLQEWVEVDVSKEQIYDVMYAMAMVKEDEKILAAIKKMREGIEAQLNKTEE